MRVLVVLPRFPYPPDRGDTVRSWNVVRALAEQHEVWLACVHQAEPKAADLATAQAYCREVAVFPRADWRRLLAGGWSLVGGRSITAGYFGDGGLAERLADWSSEWAFDALFTYSSGMAPAVRGVRAKRRVLDLGDVDSVKWEVYARQSRSPLRWLYALEARRVKQLEAAAADDHDLTLLVNAREREKFTRRLGGRPSDVLVTATDVEEFADAPPPPRAPVVGTVGSLFYPPNVRAVLWFARHVWPSVRAAVPEARWVIVGAKPPQAVRVLAGTPGVEVAGYVADVAPWLYRMRCFVNAVDNDLGVQSKLVTALAAGRPAVVSPHAAGGLMFDDPPPFVIAGRPAAFAEAVVRVLRDDAWAQALARRARETAQRYYTRAALSTELARYLSTPTTTPPRPRVVSATSCAAVIPPAALSGGVR